MVENLLATGFKFSNAQTFSEVAISPEMAGKLLEINTNNIPPVASKIRLYADLMAKGAWRYNGDSIRISKRGVLLDGQNRLMAAINAGFTLIANIIVGLDDDVFTTIDVGRVRHKGHLLAREIGSNSNRHEANIISNAISKIIKHDRGYSQHTNMNKQSIGTIVTIDDTTNYLNSHPELLEEVQYVKNQFGSRALISQATILYLYHIGCRTNQKYTRIYLEKLLKATMLSDGETLHHLHQALVKLKSKAMRWTKSDLDNTLIKVWNSVARSGLYSIRHAVNLKCRQGDNYTQLKSPSAASIYEMLNSQSDSH